MMLINVAYHFKVQCSCFPSFSLISGIGLSLYYPGGRLCNRLLSNLYVMAILARLVYLRRYLCYLSISFLLLSVLQILLSILILLNSFNSDPALIACVCTFSVTFLSLVTFTTKYLNLLKNSFHKTRFCFYE